MKKTLYTLCAICVALLLPTDNLLSCTNLLITKGATTDGSIMVTYAADSHTLFGELYFKPAANWPAGSKIDVYNWDRGNYQGQIAQIPHTYQTVGNMNQYQVIITETTFGGVNLANRDGLIDYGSLIYITLQRAKSAREAIQIMTTLTQQYGYCSSGESFSIADKNEVWIMEMIGKGDEKGTVWVAIRIPDGYVSAHANQSRIHKIPFNDRENCMYAKDVVSFAREKGLYSGTDEDFSFCDTYNPLDFSGMRGCEGRVWSAFNILGGGKFTWEDAQGVHTADANDYLDFAMGYNPDHKMPLYIKPAEKVNLSQVANVMRDHYEGTPMDMTEDPGAGVSRLPYRWRPMTYTVDGVTYTHERAIATQQTGFWLLGQARSWLPDEIGGIEWFGVDDAGTSPLTPMYTNISFVPEWFREGNGSMVDYSPTAAFWQVNKVTHFAYLFYDRVAPVLRQEIEDHQDFCQEQVA
ncbi:MAG: C69 family dipeptidase, partial [Bacteroidales bacterium]|nr:C69 family dipeptidase [Bacteroidales bacterium]